MEDLTIMEKTNNVKNTIGESDYVAFDRCDIMNTLVDLNSSCDIDSSNLKLLLNEVLNEVIDQEAKERTFLSSIYIKRSASKHLINYMKANNIACYE
jgi:CBS-domain-containing membrane protein